MDYDNHSSSYISCGYLSVGEWGWIAIFSIFWLYCFARNHLAFLLLWIDILCNFTLIVEKYIPSVRLNKMGATECL